MTYSQLTNYALKFVPPSFFNVNPLDLAIQMTTMYWKAHLSRNLESAKRWHDTANEAVMRLSEDDRERYNAWAAVTKGAAPEVVTR